MRIIAGMARGRTFDAPQGQDTRPTLDRVRENVFNILQMKVRQAKVLDLFSGSGAMAFEALSRGAEEAVLVDHDRAANAVQKRNAAKLQMAERCRILQCDWQQAVRMLQQEGVRFDVVFLDPPYAMHDMSGVMAALRPVLAEEAVVLLEHEAKTFPSTCDGFDLFDSRRYGIAGVSFFRQVHTEEE
ncbi:MAG: 16S rRNA (guanine(966)-N(2))-methyltransferase RsmD [Clostridia bacterium]|nr:16S rRNA (guanine(966)-N(2))-methyltransferase RsmD [Clostridia bacterium]